jgi:hypothetical protein
MNPKARDKTRVQVNTGMRRTSRKKARPLNPRVNRFSRNNKKKIAAGDLSPEPGEKEKPAAT